MTEDELKLQMRLYAVEILAVNLLSTACLTSGADSLALLPKIRQQMIAGARARAFPDFADPAMSDLASAELEYAVELLMEMTSTQIDAVLQAQAKKTGGS